MSDGLMTSTAIRNVCVGPSAGSGISSGDGNVCIGYNAGSTIDSGIKSTCIGYSTSVGAFDNSISLGNAATCDLSNQCTIGNSSMAIIRPGADNVCDLGESDQAFKDLYLTGDATVGGDLDIVGNLAAARWYVDADKLFTGTAALITGLTQSWIKGSVSGNTAWITESAGVFNVTSTGYYRVSINCRVQIQSADSGNYFQVTTLVNSSIVSQVISSVASESGNYKQLSSNDIITITDTSHDLEFEIEDANTAQIVRLKAGNTTSWFLFERVGAI